MACFAISIAVLTFCSALSVAVPVSTNGRGRLQTSFTAQGNKTLGGTSMCRTLCHGSSARVTLPMAFAHRLTRPARVAQSPPEHLRAAVRAAIVASDNIFRV